MLPVTEEQLAQVFAPPARTVKPRTPTRKHLPVIAIDQGEVLDENGALASVSDLLTALPTMQPTLFVKLAAADFLTDIDERFHFEYPTRWNFRTSTHERDVCRPDGKRIAKQVNVVVHYFGWRNGNFHKIIDPVTMYGRKLDEIWPEETSRPIVKLLRWGVALRDFCAENGISIRPTMGAISAQFLTDSRFYPKPRRKVPAKTNEMVREHQPGNYYYLNVVPSNRRHFTAYYLDQSSAHHYHASRIGLPASDNLYAMGMFHTLAKVVFTKIPTEFYGLYCLDLVAPDKPLPFTWTRKTGERQFVFSNELPHLLDLGYKVTGIRACWGSRKRDEGLSKYAAWCLTQPKEPWLKPILLSAYGVLAAKPTYGEAIFKLAKEGEPVTIRTGHGTLEGVLTRRRQKLEPRIANVLHRGMIEAATRSESVGLAQWLEYKGHRILSIYADAVIVEADDDKPLPQLPDPWRCHQELNHLQFVNQQAFISDAMTKLPGVSRELRDYRQHRKPGHAPRVVQYEALTNQKHQTDRRI